MRMLSVSNCLPIEQIYGSVKTVAGLDVEGAQYCPETMHKLVIFCGH